MLAQLILFAFAGLASQTVPAPIRTPPPLSVSPVINGPEDYKRLRAQLPAARRPATILNVGEVAAAQDYPKEAIEAGQQGSVEVWLLIGPDGGVQRCGIKVSSGFEALDGQTCDLFTANARFRPAIDRRGKAVQGLYVQRMVWRLEEGTAVSIRNHIERKSFVLGPAGELRSCKSELRLKIGSWMELPAKHCEEFASNYAGLLSLLRTKSKLHDAHVVLEARGFSDASEQMPPIAPDPNDSLIFLRRAVVQFDSGGKLISCTITESQGNMGSAPDPCADPTVYRRPPGLPEEWTSAGPVHLLWAIYLKNEKVTGALTPR